MRYEQFLLARAQQSALVKKQSSTRYNTAPSDHALALRKIDLIKGQSLGLPQEQAATAATEPYPQAEYFSSS
jgi:hypothetical protein